MDPWRSKRKKKCKKKLHSLFIFFGFSYFFFGFSFEISLPFFERELGVMWEEKKNRNEFTWHLVWIRAQVILRRCVWMSRVSTATKSEDIKIKISNKFKAWHFHVFAIKKRFARQTDRSFWVKRKNICWLTRVAGGRRAVGFRQKIMNFQHKPTTYSIVCARTLGTFTLPQLQK